MAKVTTLMVDDYPLANFDERVMANKVAEWIIQRWAIHALERYTCMESSNFQKLFGRWVTGKNAWNGMWALNEDPDNTYFVYISGNNDDDYRGITDVIYTIRCEHLVKGSVKGCGEYVVTMDFYEQDEAIAVQ